MARPKSRSTMCPIQIACDGVEVRLGRKMCHRCEARLNKRDKTLADLKGAPQPKSQQN